MRRLTILWSGVNLPWCYSQLQLRERSLHTCTLKKCSLLLGQHIYVCYPRSREKILRSQGTNVVTILRIISLLDLAVKKNLWKWLFILWTPHQGQVTSRYVTLCLKTSGFFSDTRDKCFSSTQFQFFAPNETWSLTPFCGRSRCVALRTSKSKLTALNNCELPKTPTTHYYVILCIGKDGYILQLLHIYQYNDTLAKITTWKKLCAPIPFVHRINPHL